MTSASLPAEISMSHGSGGRDMGTLLDTLILPAFGAAGGGGGGNDSALLKIGGLDSDHARLAFTTDAYTVTPLQFPGGDIGTLAVNGTVNDLAVAGATPLHLSCALIIEEGFSTRLLATIIDSMARAAKAAGVSIVTGDTKVVPRGAADGLFITTSGIGIQHGEQPGPHRIKAGDKVLVSGPVGDHGAAILGARGDLLLDIPVASDCRPLHTLCAALIEQCAELRCMRDATRGGVAAVSNEFAVTAGVGITLFENHIPVRTPVRGACEILGLEPLYFANEGTLIAVVSAADADIAIDTMAQFPGGEFAAVIGDVTAIRPGTVCLSTLLGSQRVLEMPAGELLPRIC